MTAHPIAGESIPSEVFQFSGQSALDTWTLKDLFASRGWSLYDRFLSDEPRLC